MSLLGDVHGKVEQLGENFPAIRGLIASISVFTSKATMSAPRVALFILALTLLLFLRPCSTASIQQGDESIQFTYSGGTGPDMWGRIKPDFAMCAKGKLQSPINILKNKLVVNKRLEPLIRFYNPTNVTLVDNKFNVGVRYPDKSGGMVVHGKMYYLKQMHWHAPSEHMIEGKQYAAELHMVHIADDGSVSVIAMLFDYGRPDPLVAKIQNKLTALAYEAKSHVDTPITLGPIHSEEIRKQSHKYYRYVGSFTTPPCTENVIWNIVAKVRSISREQVEALKAPLDMRCKKNARPCQPLNGRHVELYEVEPIVQGNRNLKH